MTGRRWHPPPSARKTHHHYHHHNDNNNDNKNSNNNNNSSCSASFKTNGTHKFLASSPSADRFQKHSTHTKVSSLASSLPPSEGPTSVYYAVVAIVSFLLFSNTLYGDFVHDDIFAIKNNRDVLPSTPLATVFRNDFWGKAMSDSTSHKSYRPLTTLSFRLNYMWGGMNPVSYHLCNVLLHSAVCVTFTSLCHTDIFSDIRPAFTAGLLFAAHPIHTEAVAGIVGRADVLACLFFLLSFMAFSRCVLPMSGCRHGNTAKTSGPHLALCLLLAACALLAKEHGATVLGVCLGFDILVLSRPAVSQFFSKSERNLTKVRPLVSRSAILIGATSLLLGYRIWLLNGHLPHFSEEDNPASFSSHLTTRFLTYSYLTAFNIWLLLCPTTLSHDWQVGSIPLVHSWWDVRNVATLTCFVSLGILGLHCLLRSKGEERKILTCALLFLVIPFLPASNLVLTVGFVVAERILYIPSLGYCILVTLGLWKLSSALPPRWSRTVTLTILFSILLCYGRRTWIRNRVWESRETLSRSGLETLPHNAKMHYNYANYLMDSGRKDEARLHFEQTLRLYPQHASAHNNLGTLLTPEDPERAKGHFLRVIEINPRHTRAHFNLANIYSNLGHDDQAEKMFEKTLEIDPEYFDAVSSLASMKQQQGDMGAAEGLYLRGLGQGLGEGSADLHNNYATFLMAQERFQEALQHYQICLNMDSSHLVAMTNMARLFRHLNRTAEAEDMYTRVLSIQRNAKVLQSLAAIYYNTDRPQLALKTYEEALEMGANNIDIQLQYGQVLARLGHYQEAENYVSAALKPSPGNPDLTRLLASIYSMQQRYSEALTQVNLALKHGVSLDQTTRAELFFEKANHLKGLNRLDDAQKMYEQALSLSPEMGTCLLNLGAIHHLKSDFQQARGYYKRALALDPNNPILIQNIAKLKRAEKKAEGHS